MVVLKPARRALVPVDSEAARRVSAPNYDEFQSDEEVSAFIGTNADSVLRVTMAHADPLAGGPALEDGSAEALERAARNMTALTRSPLLREWRDLLWVYELRDANQRKVRQVGLGGMVPTSQIRSPSNPKGAIVRNEEIVESKARGRSDLIRWTRAIVGTVNLAVEDAEGALRDKLTSVADRRQPDLAITDEGGHGHSVWLLDDPLEVRTLTGPLDREPEAYVADGNHRSASAALLGVEAFPAVLFPGASMTIRSYNRLVCGPRPIGDFVGRLGASFNIRHRPDLDVVNPPESHLIGVYTAGSWYELSPKEGAFDPLDAAQDIDANIVHRHIFSDILQIPDPRDRRIVYVGGNRGVPYLKERVDSGECFCAVTLPPVTMRQFVAVCRQGRLMPPKSTWFEPKLRSGLVMALI